MFATITRVAAVRAASARDVQGTLAWQTTGAAWTIWIAGFVTGQGQAYWGGLLVTGGLWACAASLDRMQRFGALAVTTSAYVRALLVGFAMIWAPRAASQPTADLAMWATVVALAAVAHAGAPWAVRNSGAFEFWRWWDDVKAAAACAGGAVAAVTLVGSIVSMAGVAFTQTAFVSAVTGATFCVIPTVMCLRASRKPDALRSFGGGPTSRDGARPS